MARLPRTVVPNYPHHITQRGIRRQQTFFSDDDYLTYLELMRLSCRRHDVKMLAYCLMPNHIHLVAVPASSEALRLAIGSTHEQYARQINHRHGWRGHFWQGRFFSVPMDATYLATCVRYVELNPVRARLCDSPFDYQWSSAKAHLEAKGDDLVDIWPLLAEFPDWQAYLKQEVHESDIRAIRKSSTTGRPLGSETFIEELEAATGIGLKRKKPGRKAKIICETGHNEVSVDCP